MIVLTFLKLSKNNFKNARRKDLIMIIITTIMQ